MNAFPPTRQQDAARRWRNRSFPSLATWFLVIQCFHVLPRWNRNPFIMAVSGYSIELWRRSAAEIASYIRKVISRQMNEIFSHSPPPPQTSSFGFEITRQRWGPEKSSGPKTRTGAGNNGGIRPDIYYISIYEMTGACQWASRRLLKCKRRHRVSVRAATTTKEKKKYIKKGEGEGAAKSLHIWSPPTHHGSYKSSNLYTIYGRFTVGLSECN